MDLRCTNHENRPAKARCVECGATLCGSCSVKIGGRNYCRPCVPERLRKKLPGRRSPAFASILSVVPGLGQMYAGSPGRGLVFLAATAALAATAPAVPSPIPLFLWVYNLCDAHSVATERNFKVAGLKPDAPALRQKRFFGLFGALIALFCVARATLMPDLNPDLLWPAALGLYGLFVVFDRKGSSDVQHA